MEGGLRVGFINIQGGVVKKKSDIEEFIRKEKIDIMGIAETNMRDEGALEIEGYRWEVRGTDQRVGGVGVLIKEKLIYRVDTGNREGWVSISVLTKSGWVECFFTYLWQLGKRSIDGEAENEQMLNEIRQRVENSERKQKPVIIMGDFNGRMGEKVGDIKGSQNKWGKRVNKWAEENNLEILNGKKGIVGKWTRMCGNQRSIIDYIMVSNSIWEEGHFSGKIYDKDGVGIKSDHRPIVLQIEEKVEGGLEKKGAIKGWKRMSEGDWTEYNRKVEELWERKDEQTENNSQNMRVQDSQEQWEDLQSVIGEGIDHSIGNKYIKKLKEGNRWKKSEGNENIKEAKKKTQKAKRRWEQALGRKDIVGNRVVKQRYEKYIKKREIVGKLTNNEKQKEKERIRVKIVMENSSREAFWKRRKRNRKKKGRVKVLKTKEGGLATTDQEIERELEKHLESLEKDEGGGQKDSVNIETDEAIQRGNELGGEIENSEIFKVIQEAKSGKAEGDDKIPNEAIKNGGNRTMEKMKTLFNTIREEEKTPKEWREGEAVLLEKKGDKEILDNYRGIMLQSCVGKMYGKVWSKRLTGDAEERGINSDLQFAFREGRCGMEAVYILGEIIDKGREEKKDYSFCFLDIKKAYDKVDRDVLWERVAEEGYGGKTLRILKEMYRDNKVSLRLGGNKNKKNEKNEGAKTRLRVVSVSILALHK